MDDIAIRVENLSKQYPFDRLTATSTRGGRAGCIGGPQARYKTIRESLTEAMQAPFRRLSSVVRGQSSAISNETIWALKDVSFEACPELSRRVQRGEVVGIPSASTPPPSVPPQAGGRTGRENITLNGAIPSIYSGQAWG